MTPHHRLIGADGTGLDSEAVDKQQRKVELCSPPHQNKEMSKIPSEEQKYNRENVCGFNVPEDELRRLEVDEAVATVSYIEFSDTTVRNITDEKTAASELMHPPTVDVTFKTSKTRFVLQFKIDPFVVEPFEEETEDFFGTVLAATDVSWNNLPDVIGSEITLKRMYGTDRPQLQEIKEPVCHANLGEVDSGELYDENIENLFVDLIVQQTKNMSAGYANPQSIETEDEFATVVFDLPYGGCFKQRFALDSDTEYNFWEFFRDSIGYVPTGEEYNELIGETVDVEYTTSGWLVSDPEVKKFY